MDKFKLFIKKNKLVDTLISYVMATKVSEVFNSFIDDLIMPIIERDADGDGIADSYNLKNYKYNIFKIKFKIGNFIFIIIKFIILLYLTYILSNILEYIL